MNVLHGAVLVTGAASGIGAAVTGWCLAAGAVVAGLDAVPPPARDTPDFVPLTADVRDESAIAAALSGLDSRFAALAGLVNCAGVGGYTGDVTETEPAEWDRVLGVNLTGAYLVSRVALPRLRAAEGGAAIVHVASQYALVGGAGFPAYIAAKAGLVGLTRAMAVDHGPERIRVNCVCPGPTDTPMLRHSGTQPADDRERTRVAHRSLLPAPADPARVADAIGFLLGPAAGAMTGTVVPVDGGWTAS
jgi:meso-butanediol dehydrogenase / (S,S)-butanediol dehydrogenase / diacetyl reductase